MFGYALHPDDLQFAAVATSTQIGEKYAVTLYPNYCFPGGGGYPADKGTIYNVFFDSFVDYCPLVDVPISGEVVVAIDKQHRFLSSQLHSGYHVLSAVLLRDFAADSTSFTIFDDYATIEVNRKLTAEYIAAAELAVNEYIIEGITVQSSICEGETQLPVALRHTNERKYPFRAVKIGALDVCGCCGTHVKSTSQLLICKVVSAQNVKNGYKLYFMFGLPAFKFLNDKFRIVEALTQQLTTSDTYLAHSVSLLQDQAKQHKKKAYALFKLLVPQLACENALVVGACYCVSVESLTLENEEIYALIAYNSKKYDDTAVACQNGAFVHCALTSKSKKAAEVLRLLKEREREVTGGGNDQRISVSFKGKVDDFIARLECVFH